MVTIILCSVFTLILVGGFSLYQGSRYIKDQAEEKLTFMGKSYANEFSQSLKETESYVDSLNTAIVSSFDMEQYREDEAYIGRYQQQLDELMKSFSMNHNNALGIYVTFDPYLTREVYEIWYEDIKNNGQMFRVSEELIRRQTSSYTESWKGYPNPEIFKNRSDEAFAYLYKTMEEKKPLWFKPYKESGLDITVISYVVPLTVENRVLGVVGMDINFETIETTINNIKVYDSGYAVLLDEAGQIIVPSEKESIEYDRNGKEEIFSYSRLSNGWILCLIPDSSEIYRPVFLLSKWMIVLTTSGILFSILIAYFFSRRVSRTMEGAAKQLRYIEIGDFTKEIPKELLNGRDDLGQFIKSIHAIQETMKNLIQEIEEKGIGSYYNTRFLSSLAEDDSEMVFEADSDPEPLRSGEAEKEADLHKVMARLEDTNRKLQTSIQQEVMKNRQRDAVMMYQSRQAKMGEMIGNIAHQWKQPLNSLIVILTELIDAYEYDELDQGYFEKEVGKAQRIICQMSQTIEDFRDFLNPSREKDWFSVANQIRFACELMDNSIRTNKIKLSINLISDGMVYGFANEFSQVVTNVIDNAKDALLSYGGAEKRIQIDIGQIDGEVRVMIFNSGNPIPPEIMDQMFLPFYTTKMLGKGSGIGLYMSKLIMEEHLKGRIQYENVSGGVRCLIFLPAQCRE